MRRKEEEGGEGEERERGGREEEEWEGEEKERGIDREREGG